MPDQRNTSPADTNAQLTAFEALVEHRYADNAGVQIHYAAAGTGRLIVLMHGFPDHWLGWWQVMRELRDGHRVVAMDLRGYNLSDKPGDTDAYAVSHLVGDLRAVIHHEGAQSAVVVGHDWGGFVAWHAAMDAPELVDALVVLNMPHPWAISRELATNPLQQKASEYVRLFKQAEAHRGFPRERLNAWVKDSHYLARHEQAMSASSVNAMFNYYRANWPPEPYAVRLVAPPRVKVPALLMHGLLDPYALPAGLNDGWAWSDRELLIHTLPEGGHFIQYEQGPWVAARLRRWLQGLAG